MEKFTLDMTGGIAENFETTPKNFVKSSINYEKTKLGEVTKRTEPSTFDSGLLDARIALDFTAVIKPSSPVYGTNLPTLCEYDWYLLVYGVSGGSYSLFLYYSISTSWKSEDLTSLLASIDVEYTSQSRPRFWVSADGVLIADGVNKNHKVFINSDGEASVRHLGLPSPLSKIEVDTNSESSSFVKTDTTSTITGMTIERGSTLMYSYTYSTKDGDESNPSPVTVSTDISCQFYNTIDYDLGFEYWWNQLKLNNIKIYASLSDFEGKEIEKINIYRATRRLNDSPEPFSDFAYVFSIGASTEEISTGDSAPAGSVQISYANDQAPVAKDICKINGIIASIGAKDDALDKFPVDINYAWRIRLNNPNGQYYSDRAFHLMIDENDSIFDGNLDIETDLVENGDLRFFESDFVTPIPYSFHVVPESIGSEEIENPTTVNGTSFTLTGEFTGTAAGIAKTATTMTSTFYQTNTVTVTVDGYYKIFLRGEAGADGGQVFLYATEGGNTIRSRSFDVFFGDFYYSTALYLFAGNTYTIGVNASITVNIKRVTYFSLIGTTDFQKAHVYINPSYVFGSGNTDIFMCIGDTWLAPYTDAIHGLPVYLSNNPDSNYTEPFARSRVRTNNDILVSPQDNLFKKTDTELALIGYNFYSNGYYELKRDDGTIGIADNFASWDFFDINKKIQRSRDGYSNFSYSLGSSNAELRVSNMVNDELIDLSYLTVTGHYKGLQTNVSSNNMIFGSEDGSDGVIFGLNVYVGELFFFVQPYDGGAGSSQSVKIDSYDSNTVINLFYVVSFNIDEGYVNYYLFYNNSLIKGSFTHDYQLKTNLLFGSNEIGVTVPALQGLYEQLNIYRDVFIDTIEKAESLNMTHPYISIDTIGWNKFVSQDPVNTSSIGFSSSANKIRISGVDLTSVFTENTGIWCSPEEPTLALNKGIYFVKESEYSSGITNITVYNTIAQSSSTTCDVYAIEYNNNVTIENISNKNESNIIKYTDPYKTSFPDLYFKETRENCKRILPSPSFLNFQYENTFLVWTRNNVERFILKGDVGSLSTDISNLIPENENYGLLDDDSITMSKDALYWRSEVGIVEWDLNGIRIISNYKMDGEEYKLINIPDDIILKSDYIPQKNQIIFYKDTSSYSAEDVIYVFDIDEREWRHYKGIDVDWSIRLTKSNTVYNYNLFFTHSDTVNQYPDLSASPSYPQASSLEKDSETYYALWDGVDYDVENDGSIDIDATVTVENRKFATDKSKIYSDIESFKRYGLPIGFYGDKINIKIEDALTIKPCVVSLKNRKSRR